MATATLVRTCVIEGCDRGPNEARRFIKGMCSMHYKRFKRGTLDKPRYSRPRGSVGMTTVFPFDFEKRGDIWFRRPTGSDEPWVEGTSYAPFLPEDRVPDMIRARGAL